MRITSPPAGDFRHEPSLDLTDTPLQCPDLHDLLWGAGVSAGVKYWVFDEMYAFNRSSVKVRNQIKGEAIDETDQA